MNGIRVISCHPEHDFKQSEVQVKPRHDTKSDRSWDTGINIAGLLEEAFFFS
jgi:hypothetical protein